MEPSQLLILLTAICICALCAHRFRIATPIAFLIGGIVMALLPGMTPIRIKPEHMLVIFLPPILMEAAFFTSIRDFKSDLRAILLLAVGLVIVTAVAIAGVVVALIPGASWALGFVLGGIVSPPDAAAAIGALRGVRLPKRIVTILEGESLINDASGIVIYKLALTAVVLGSFSFADAGSLLAWKMLGGTGIGLVVAWLFVTLYPYVREPSVEILSTFVPPYAAFMLAEWQEMSGVLAVVAAGLYIGWHAPRVFTSRMRIPAEAVWKMLTFFLNALAFLLIGLELPGLIQNLHLHENPHLIALALVVCITSVIVRFAWVYSMAYGLRYLLNRVGAIKEEYPNWQNVFVIGWTGMRGVVTLALALALPLTLTDGSAFPHRDLLIFLGTGVILFTLLIQGLSLPWLTRTLSLTFDIQRMQEEWHARVIAAQRAIARLDHLKADASVHLPALARIREHYSERLESLGDGPNTPLDPSRAPGLMSHPLLQAENRLWKEALHEEREALLSLRRDFKLSDDILYDILREMDLLAARFHHEEETAISTMPDIIRLRRRMWQRFRRRPAV